MNTETTALIISGAISLTSTYLAFRTFLSNRYDRHAALFGDEVFKRRFEYYPQLYEICSNFKKNLRKGLPVERFIEIQEQVLAWDSKYSYLGSSNFNLQLAQFYLALEASSKDTERLAEILVSERREKGALAVLIERVEVALKRDLGITDIELSAINEPITSYEELIEAAAVPRRDFPLRLKKRIARTKPGAFARKLKKQLVE